VCFETVAKIVTISADRDEGAWAVQVRRGGDFPELRGMGVVIDRYRVLTCAHVLSDLIAEDGEARGPAKGGFL
jgi:hypothetical protein